ncbi:MAG: hypothetical protein H7333_03995 [Bdellovibrionales bacterium]|nr:hypothetical protein [Oligoflexia bacterium]
MLCFLRPLPLRYGKMKAAQKYYPISLSFLLISSLIFFTVNRGGDLPANVLERLGFSASMPAHEWPYRTITSDWLYTGSLHFYVCVPIMFLLLLWAERKHSRRFLIGYLCAVSFVDDFVNYFLILHPFQYVRPELFHSMISQKDVGSSLILSSLLGLQIVQIDRYREFIFVFLSIAFVLGTVFTNTHYASFVLNLNHFIFLCLGYFAGKLQVVRNRSKERRQDADDLLL